MGSPTGDRATFQRLDSGWTYAYGGDPSRPCTYALVAFWLPARVTAGPLLSADVSDLPGRYRPSIPEAEWLDDIEESA